MNKRDIVGSLNRYGQIIERIFFSHHAEGEREITFERREIEQVAQELGVALPKNLGDIIYSFRYRAALPESVRATAGTGESWIIQPAGRAIYRFVLLHERPLVPSEHMGLTKVPDATPGLVAKYALDDEQGRLAKIRYNRLIDIFTGVTCYSLQNHLRTTIPNIGQVETDEIYVGVDRRGVHYIFPVQAKGGKDRLSIVQIEQDFALCTHKFPALVCRPIAAQFLARGVIALFDFEESETGLVVVSERHYQLVPPDEVLPDDLEAYRARPLNG